MRSMPLTWLAALLLVLAPTHALAQDDTEQDSAEETAKEGEQSATPGEKTEAAAEEMKKEDREVRAQPAAKPLEAPGAAGDELAPLEPPADDDFGGELPPLPAGYEEVSMDEAQAAKPPANILDLHGYLRLRGDLNSGVDLGLDQRTENGVSYPQFPRPASGRGDTIAMANMRFRLEPTINISEDVRIMAQVDILDNLILGSTPDGYPQNQYYPLVVFSQGQTPPVQGINSLRDSITVKRAWGEVMTPLGLLRFGRMPSHWGLGLLANDGGPAHVDNGPLVTRPSRFSSVGQCFDCDFGSTADRILFATKLFGHYIVPMVDFTSEGPYFSWGNEYNGQHIDADQLDDVNSWIIAIFKRDKPEDIKHALDQGDWVLNYGVYFVFRNQALDGIEFNKRNGDAYDRNFYQEDQYVDEFAVRNAEAYIPDFWVRFMWQKLRIELEFVLIAGKIGYTNVQSNIMNDGSLNMGNAECSASILQYGGVLQADYTMLDDKLILGLEMGLASGDNSPGMGVRPFAEKQFESSERDEGCGDRDDTINNFRFNLDYHVDMILWRQIIGTVTDAIYVKPTVQYNIAEGLGAKVSAIYSSAMYKESTRGKAHPLGLEFDIDFFYFSDDNFHAGIAYGLLIPFGGMKDLGDDMAPGGIAQNELDNDANIAHRILGRLVIYF